LVQQKVGKFVVMAAITTAMMLIAIPPALAHPWMENWISHDHVSNGVQGHGGVTTKNPHNKYQTVVRVKRCAPVSECEFIITSDGHVRHFRGGTVTTLAMKKRLCFDPGYSSLHGGYTCQTMTSVVSKNGGYCWSTVTNRIWNSSGELAHSGDWASNLGNCTN
jgi:hypothetical protein